MVDAVYAVKQFSSYFLIDLLKVFAALLIILHHLSSYGQIALDARSVLPGIMTWLFEYGRYAVQIFLVMAGYLACQSLTKYADSKFSVVHLLKVILNRYLRLFAPYAAALLFTIACAYLARHWVADEFVGQNETLTQFLAHLFFLQGILGLDSISAGAWYIAIDWQLYAVLALILISFRRYQAVIWLMTMLAIGSLLYFNRSSQYEAYFIYFIGAYGLGVLAYLASSFPNSSVHRIARLAIYIIGLLIVISTLHQLWLRNFLAWAVAALLVFWGSSAYPQGKTVLAQQLLAAIAWASQRSYCAFLIHFAFILLANTAYIAFGWNCDENGLLAISLMAGVVVLSWIGANVLYRWVELPSRRLKVHTLPV